MKYVFYYDGNQLEVEAPNRARAINVAKKETWKRFFDAVEEVKEVPADKTAYQKYLNWKNAYQNANRGDGLSHEESLWGEGSSRVGMIAIDHKMTDEEIELAREYARFVGDRHFWL